MDKRDPLLVTRETTHGNYADNAEISQSIKSIFRGHPGWARLEQVERESIDMIVFKLARITTGKSMHRPHWEDVVGYGNLVLEKCD